ncbi:sigma-70 family RNA polymerase sigma factor [Algivirga pacifica]
MTMYHLLGRQEATEHAQGGMLSEVFQEYYAPMKAYGIKITQDESLTQDAIQDLFARLWENRDHLQDIRSIQAYLFRALRNNLIKCVKEQQKHQHVGEWDWNTTEIELSDEEQIIQKEDERAKQYWLENSLSTLSNRQREVVQLKFYEGKSYEEIGAITGIKYQSLRNLIYKAVATMRKHGEPVM